MQALDRTAPVLPIMPAAPGRQTHDYVRHGTTSLFGALDVATGEVIGQHQRRNRQCLAGVGPTRNRYGIAPGAGIRAGPINTERSHVMPCPAPPNM